MSCCKPASVAARARSWRADALRTALSTYAAIALVLSAEVASIASETAEPQPSSPAKAVRLTSDGRLKMHPVFIADGAELVFTVLESPEQTSLMKLRLADGAQERLNPKAATTEFEAAFSGDGRYCAFVQNRGNLSLQLVIRDRLENRDAIFDPGGGFAGMRHPSFAPEGGKLIVSLPGGGGEQIVEIGLDGRRGKSLTEGESLNSWPAYSPDGRQIAFGSNRDGDFELYAMNAAGGDVRRLTLSPNRDLRPAWSPDGQRIAFTTARDGNSEIYVMNADGSSPVRLTDNPEQDDFAAWRPDGRRLAFVSERDGKFDLYLLDAVALADAAAPPAARELHVARPPEAVVQSLGLSSFYCKYVDAGGFPVLGSAKASDFALLEAAFLIDRMLRRRPDVRRALIASKTRFAVMAPQEMTTQIPEHSDLRPKDYWDRRARGLGATEARPAVTCGEENLLCLPGDPYHAENILIHEFAHAIHEMGLNKIDGEFDRRLKAAYEQAMSEGLWKSTYASTNRNEYWAEGVQSWFDTNRPPDRDHNHVDTREELKEYDPRLAALAAEVFGDGEWRYVRPSVRKPSERAHLDGFDPVAAGRFAWPERLQALGDKIREDALQQRTRTAAEASPRDAR